MILISILISWCIAMSANLDKLELGAIVNLIYPIILGIASLLFYWLLSKFIKNKFFQFCILILTLIFNIGLGLYIRFVNF